jgi:hypothetical protein
LGQSARKPFGKSRMTKHNVTLNFEIDCDDEYEAAHDVYRMLAQRLLSPSRGRVIARVTNMDNSDSFDIDLFDGVLEVDPLFAAQVIGVRHLIWVNQNPPRSKK